MASVCERVLIVRMTSRNSSEPGSSATVKVRSRRPTNRLFGRRVGVWLRSGSAVLDRAVPKPTKIDAPGFHRARSQRSISRVLSFARVAPCEAAVIHLGRASPRASCGLPWSSGGQPSNAPLRGLAPDGVCHATRVTARAVGSYSAVSPLPGAASRPRRFAFLWHFPRGHPHRALPGILPYGARTFLPAPKRRAIA